MSEKKLPPELWPKRTNAPLAPSGTMAGSDCSPAIEVIAKPLAVHSGTLAHPQAVGLGLSTLVTDAGYDKLELEKCDVGISECDALVAQTGTVLVTSRSAGGRALSCLPPHHVVIARRAQLVPDLPAAMALVKQEYDGNYPSMISFITGPSRTGDIEWILVLGAHGPKRLTIFCLP